MFSYRETLNHVARPQKRPRGRPSSGSFWKLGGSPNPRAQVLLPIPGSARTRRPGEAPPPCSGAGPGPPAPPTRALGRGTSLGFSKRSAGGAWLDARMLGSGRRGEGGPCLGTVQVAGILTRPCWPQHLALPKTFSKGRVALIREPGALPPTRRAGVDYRLRPPIPWPPPGLPVNLRPDGR